MRALKLKVKEEGQPYVDEPVYLRPQLVSPIEASVAQAFGRKLPKPLLHGHERVRLRWVNPDGTPKRFV